MIIRTLFRWQKGTYVEYKHKAFGIGGETVEEEAPVAIVDFLEAAPHILKPIFGFHEPETLAGEVFLDPCHFLHAHILSNRQLALVDWARLVWDGEPVLSRPVASGSDALGPVGVAARDRSGRVRIWSGCALNRTGPTTLQGVP